MSRNDNLVYLLEQLPRIDDAFIEDVVLQLKAKFPPTIYETLSLEQKAEIEESIAELDRGHGIPIEEVFAKTDAMLKAAGA